MYSFHPYFTNDGSVGLYNEDFNDIYHSSTGAITEAYEKFVAPIDIYWLLNQDKIKVLDICYGIGYNSKTFLNFIFENFSLKKNKKNNYHADSTIATIYTNKILPKNNGVYSDTIHTNNIFSKLSITAVDTDEILCYLSPFIKTGKKNFKNVNFDFDTSNVEKYLKKDKNKNFPKINKLINFLILEKIAQNSPKFLKNHKITSILSNKLYTSYFEADIRGIFEFYQNQTYRIKQKGLLNAFLHNIYYRYISQRYKKAIKHYNLESIDFEYKNGDARNIIKADNNIYNLVFLDAFTPSKCPCLWSYDFFKLLYDKTETDGLILTYSTSAAIRAAMIEAGFYIGNIYNERLNKYTGTIATKNKTLIKHPLSEFDLGLLKTTAGIFYRDENLTGLNEAIRSQREYEVKNSTRLSTSKYKKQKFIKEDSCSTM